MHENMAVLAVRTTLRARVCARAITSSPSRLQASNFKPSSEKLAHKTCRTVQKLIRDYAHSVTKNTRRVATASNQSGSVWATIPSSSNSPPNPPLAYSLHL